MTALGFHAAHELHSPSRLLRLAQQAERAGFRAGMCSDHLHPWVPAQGNSGYSFAWLGAALQATSMTFGTICCPNYRYHPAIVAQAVATLGEMYPGRVWLALGTGQALNETVSGLPWTSKPQRQQMVQDSAEAIRALWAGECVTRRGAVKIEHARLYSRPAHPPRLLGAALTPETACWVGSWADGLLTVNAAPHELRKVVDAFRQGGGAGKPMFLQAMVGYDPDERRAWQDVADLWPIATLDQHQLQNLETPEQIAAACGTVRPEDLRSKNLRVSSDLGQHIAWLQGDFALGFECIYLHAVTRNPESFLEAFADKVLPACHASR